MYEELKIEIVNTTKLFKDKRQIQDVYLLIFIFYLYRM